MVLGRATATGFLWGKHWAKALPLCVRQFGSIHAGKHTASLGLQTRPSSYKIIRLGEVLGDYGCYLFRGLGKERIIGTNAEPRRYRFSTTLASQAKGPL